jgi:gluconokinase
MIVLLMGVTGSGKTTVGKLLGRDLGWQFYDGDDYHPDSNVRRMAQGIPLTDEDRRAWLDTLRKLLEELVEKSEPAVVACSALKESYRRYLLGKRQDIRLVYLKGDYELIQKRLEERRGHFAGARLLQSQFEALEEPQGALEVSVLEKPERIVKAIIEGLPLQ